MKVADAIHQYIHQNNLAPGDKIPSERVLAEQLKTGRNSVREALRVLENEGTIEVKTGKGAFVSQSSTAGSIYFKLMKVNYIELLEIKTVLEQEAVRRLAESATPSQLANLDRLLAEVEQEAAQKRFSVEKDRKFHQSILEYSRNKLLVQMVGNMIDALDNYSGELDDPVDIWINTIPLHREMLEAIRRHDPAEACAAHKKILETDLSVFNRLSNN